MNLASHPADPGRSSSSAPTRRPRPSLFYGWWVVLASGATQILGSGFFFYGLGSFFLPLTNEFGWSRALTSSAFSLDRFQGILISPIVGIAFDRLGPRRLMLFGTTMVSIGFLILSQVQSFPAFALSVVFMSAGFATGFGTTGMATVANWFQRKRMMALGILMAGAGLSGLMVPILVQSIESFGWRNAALAVAVANVLLGWPLAFVVRHRPEDVGLRPDGDSCDANSAAGTGQVDLTGARLSAREPAERPIRIGEALRDRAFWLLGGVESLKMVAHSAFVVHAIPYLSSAGFDTTVAASVVAAMTVVSVVGRIGFGWVGDRVPKRPLLAALLGMQVIGLIVFANVSAPWQLVVFLVLHAPAFGGTVPLRPALQADYFGRSSFGTIQGVLISIVSVGSMIGPILAGAMFDALGSYRLAFLICAGTVAAAIPLALALPAPRPGSRTRLRAN